jgi:hypothetical protein
MKIWIDTLSGTWGSADTLVLADVSEGDLAQFDSLSDSALISYATIHGKPVV